MPRYIVTICDTDTGEISHQVGKYNNEIAAICDHYWLTEIYRQQYITKMFWKPTEEECRQALCDLLSWSVSCVNLDTEIMNDLNGGDLSASSQMLES